MNTKKTLTLLACASVFFAPSIASAADQDGREPEAPYQPEEEPAVIDERRMDEASLNEDPEAQRRSLAHSAAIDAELAGEPAQETDVPAPVELYASIRAHAISTFDRTSGDRQSEVSDAGSRLGMRVAWQFNPNWQMMGRAEYGIDLVESFSSRGDLFGDGGLTERLLHVGIDHQNLTLTYGKNWSSYYQVAGLTDRFVIFGGSASGAFNAGSSGQFTGTGRPDDVLQARVFIAADRPIFRRIKPFNLNLQRQEGQAIPAVPGERYDYSWGASAIFETLREFTLGVAYNHAVVPEGRSAIQAAGIDGDATALALATRLFGDTWYAALLVSQLENMEVTELGQYFDATGVELYAQWEFRRNWWLIGGGNWLDPDAGETNAGLFRERYLVVGGRYSFESFRRMLFFEYKYNDSRLSTGASVPNEFTLGVRWDFGS